MKSGRILWGLIGLFQLTSCGLFPKKASPPFPAHWWQEVPRSQAAHWEILPQDAGDGEVILSKRNELGLFSNFAETPFVFRGRCYPTLEAFWQMMKFPEGKSDPRWSWGVTWPETREAVSRMSGFAAKKAGDAASRIMKEQGADWVSFEGRRFPYRSAEPGEHARLIETAMLEKLRQNPELQKLLLATGELRLRPDHEVAADSPPEWKYHLIWMKFRHELRRGSLSLKSAENLSLRSCGGPG